MKSIDSIGSHYRYIDPSRHDIENCLPPQFVSQSCLGRPLAARPAKGALRDKSWKETIFKVSAQFIYVYIYIYICVMCIGSSIFST